MNLGQIKNRKIQYFKYTKTSTWYYELPPKKWLLLTIVDEIKLEQISEIARHAIDRDVAFLSAIGLGAEYFHDCFDEELILRESKNENSAKDFIPTTWFEQFDEGFWFATTLAQTEQQDINTIVCLNLTTINYSLAIQNMIVQINNGWTPS